MPKEMLPVVDKPAIQYVVEEAVAAGLQDMLLVTARGKGSIEDHFDRAHELEEALAAKGDETRLAMVRRPSELATVHTVRQGAPRGLGHAVLTAAEHVRSEPFAVLLPDDIIDQGDRLLSRMIETRRRYGGSVVALMEIDPGDVSRYGVVAMTPTHEDDIVTVTDLVEKPEVGHAPSNWIVIGRYICDASIFDILRNTPPGKDGEIQLTDALGVLARREQPDNPGAGVHGVMFHGLRHDTGSQLGYLRTVVHFACEHPNLAGEFIPWLRKHIDNLQ